MRIDYVSFNDKLDKCYVYVFNDSPYPDRVLSIYIDGEDYTSASRIIDKELDARKKGLIIISKNFIEGSMINISIKGEKKSAMERVRVLKPFFPVGCYGGSTILRKRENIMEAIELGFDTIVAGVNELDMADKYDFKVITSLPTVEKNGESTVNLDLVEKYKTHKSLLAWYIIDEPDIWELIGKVPRGWTEKWTKYMRNIDPIHPTYIVLCNDRKFEIFAKTPDILAVDPYPVSRLPLKYVSDMVLKAKLASNPRPLWLISQAFRHGRPPIGGYWGWKRFPIPEEEKIMVYLGLSHGCKGVIYFTYGSFIDVRHDPVEGLDSRHRDSIRLKRGIAGLSGELHALGKLLPLGDVYGDYWDIRSTSGLIEVKMAMIGNFAFIIFVVNHNYISGEYDFKINPVNNVEIKFRLPHWFEINDCFTITSRGFDDINVRRNGRDYVIRLEKIDTAMPIVLASDEKTRNRMYNEWRQWRRF